jgi:uncharacterized protein YgiM (DUF1202 family)
MWLFNIISGYYYSGKFFFYVQSESTSDPDSKEAVSSSNATSYFTVKQDCQTYTKPDIESDISGHLELGEELLIENVNKFNYFYELTDENGKNSYVRKECLQKIKAKR